MDNFKVICMLNTDLCPDALAPLKKIAEVCHLPIDRDILLNEIDKYDAYFGHTDIVIDKEIIEKGKRLKVIAAPSTGTDHIDVKTLRDKGIELLSLTREYELLDGFTATAECAWALLLACIRKLPAATSSVIKGDWARERYTGTQLSGKTLGVLGVGRLGKMVVEYGKAFRMRVLGCDLRNFNIPDVQPVDFDTLLRESDVLSLHIHLNEETKGIISRSAFNKMKDGVVLINTSRGGLIDEAAFLEALESGKVAAAGLDIINGEWMTDITKHPLVRYAQKHDNLVITPHIGGASIESIVGARRFLAQKLADYLCEHKNKEEKQ